MQQATCCVNVQAGNRIEMASAKNESNSSMNENIISTQLSHQSAPNRIMPIENNANQSNGISSVPKEASDSAPSNVWKCRKCSKINDDRTNRCRKPCFSWKPGVKRSISIAKPQTMSATNTNVNAGS